MFGQKASAGGPASSLPSGPMQTRSQTSMMVLENAKHYLHQMDLRTSPKQQLVGKPASKKGSKVKVVSHAVEGGVSARSSLNPGGDFARAQYSQKTFYSNYIGANSAKGGSGVNTSHTSSFVKKSRNNSHSTIQGAKESAASALPPSHVPRPPGCALPLSRAAPAATCH